MACARPLTSGLVRPVRPTPTRRARPLKSPAASPPDATPADLASALLGQAARQLDRDLGASGPPSTSSSSFTERALPGGAGRAWHSEQRDERATPGGGFARSFRSSTVVVWGVDAAPVRPVLPPAAAPPSLLSPAVVVAAVLAGAYAAVARAFARGFARATTYRAAAKWRLALLWPVLALVSPSFRAQLRAALAADREGTTGDDGKDKAEPSPPSLPRNDSPPGNGGRRTTADSTLFRPDRWQGGAGG